MAPRAQIEDATPLLDEVRRIKTADQRAGIPTSVTVAGSALAHALAGLRPGVPGRRLTGRVAEHMAGLGVTIPDLEGAFWSTSPVLGPVGLGRRSGAVGHGRPSDVREISGSPVSTEALPADALVAAHVGAMFAGYERVVARTCVDPPVGREVAAPTPGQRRLQGRWSALRGHPWPPSGGRGTGSDLCVAAYERVGEAVPTMPVAHGVGLGMEPPMVGKGLPDDTGGSALLRPGMVLFVLGEVADPDTGTVLAGESLLMTDSGHESLTRLGYGSLGGTA